MKRSKVLSRGSVCLLLLTLTFVSCGDGGGSSSGTPVTVVKSNYTTQTADGWTIAVQRYRRTSGTIYQEPVLVASGYLENSKIFDAFPNHSLTHDLAMRGYDVWTYDIRGTGDSQTPEISWSNLEVDFSIDWTNFDFNLSIGMKGWDYSIDHFALLDTPAALDFVLKQTGASQVLGVGHSMGAFMLYVCMQNPMWASKIRACSTLGGIGFIKAGTDYQSLYADLFFEIGTFLAPLIPSNLPLPLKWALDQLLEDDPIKWAVLAYALDTVVGKLFWNHENMNSNLVYQFLRHGLPNTTTNCFKQFLNWADTGDCTLNGIELPASVAAGMGYAAGGIPVESISGGKVRVGKGYSITKNLGKISRPTQILAGTADFMAPPEFCQEVFNRLATKQKEYHACSAAENCGVDFGHVDMTMGLAASREIYPRVSGWLSKHATRR